MNEEEISTSRMLGCHFVEIEGDKSSNTKPGSLFKCPRRMKIAAVPLGMTEPCVIPSYLAANPKRLSFPPSSPMIDPLP